MIELPDATCLAVYDSRSILYEPGRKPEVFDEGPQSADANKRYQLIQAALAGGFLDEALASAAKSPIQEGEIAPAHASTLAGLVRSVTSEVGRAMVGLAVLQLAVKAICPEQSIRLHKGASKRGRDFSWAEGISMRNLDRLHVTPFLRNRDLLRLNRDGFMMTRTLAENYPYSRLYKAAIRGARSEWMRLVEALEDGSLDPRAGLRFLLGFLLNRSKHFQDLSARVIGAARVRAGAVERFSEVVELFESFVARASYSARVFEISMHALLQALDEAAALQARLRPLSQMRSANKKHGNVGDIELVLDDDGNFICEAWDAKYGKPYLRDELEELHEKLEEHEELRVAGFVVDCEPQLTEDVLARIRELEEMHGVDISVVQFRRWATDMLARSGAEERDIGRRWLIAFAESIGQRRREIAPIDEPCEVWLGELAGTLGLEESE